ALEVPADAVPPLLDADTVEHIGSGDLGSHFDPPVVEAIPVQTRPSRARVVSDNWGEITALGGHIGTVRVFRQEGAPDPRTLVLFGDSYGFGDDVARGLSWQLAQVFAEVHFVWAPFGWDPSYLDSVHADLVICQAAERFVGRVPRAAIDVRSLTRETIAGASALTEERVFAAQND
ncbi:MAG TPA: hypothetical protein VFW29_12370, partial [Solirubrobacteraceae bacterium]|nr:hypothetical protein [Solirubrobacteraceae bacterium]